MRSYSPMRLSFEGILREGTLKRRIQKTREGDPSREGGKFFLLFVSLKKPSKEKGGQQDP